MAGLDRARRPGLGLGDAVLIDEALILPALLPAQLLAPGGACTPPSGP